MKVKINQSKCISCGLCTTIAPDTFQLDSQTKKSKVVNQPEEITEKIQQAINGCPTQAIEKVDE